MSVGREEMNPESHFILRDDAIWQNAVNLLRVLEPSHYQGEMMEVIIRPFQKTRSLPQNSRYWASLTEYLNQIHQTIQIISDESGYTPLEVKRLIADDLKPEQVAILFARTPEVAHDVIKEICNVPTSARLGTKRFMLFEEQMERTIAEIAGQIEVFKTVAL